MAKDGRRDLPKGVTPKLRTQGSTRLPVTTEDGTPVYRVRLWDPVLKRQIERTAEGLDAAKKLLADFNEAKRRPGRLQAERVRFADVAARYLLAYRAKRGWHSTSKVVVGQGADLPERLHPPRAR